MRRSSLVARRSSDASLDVRQIVARRSSDRRPSLVVRQMRRSSHVARQIVARRRPPHYPRVRHRGEGWGCSKRPRMRVTWYRRQALSLPTIVVLYLVGDGIYGGTVVRW